MNKRFGLLTLALVATACGANGIDEDGPIASREDSLVASTYMLRALGGKCVTAGGARNVGDRIVLSDCTNAASQRFSVSKVGEAFELRNNGLCVDVQGANFANRTPLQLWTCNGTNAQRFDIRGNLIRPVAALSYAVEVQGGFTANGTPIQLYQRNLTASQDFRFLPAAVTANPTAGVSLTSAAVPTCTTTQVQAWDRAQNEREGAAVLDPKNEVIGSPYSKRNGNYAPLTGRKETFCGQLTKFGLAGDDDWNLHLVPSGVYRTMLDQHDPTRAYLEVETAVDKKYWKASPWFHTDWGKSSLENRTICAYGPFVEDCGHYGEYGGNGKKVEVHPGELLWWRDRLPAYTDTSSRTITTDYFTFMHLHDNSGEYDDWDNFGGTSSAPAGWEPWANAPLRSVVRMPWSYTPWGPTTEMRIVDDFVWRVVTSRDATLAADSTTAAEQTLAIDGRIVLRVSETTELDGNLGVRLNEANAICRRPGTQQILGFVDIRNDISEGDDSDLEGVHTFFVARSTVQTPIFVQPIATTFLTK